MTELIEFKIQFHGPFRIAAGDPGVGADVTVDLSQPLPGPALKGLMRHAGRLLLGSSHPLVAEVFGSPGQYPSPWAWSDGRVEVPHVATRARNTIDPRSGTVIERGLVVAEEIHASTGSFFVERTSSVDPERKGVHFDVLAVAGQAVHSIGSDRSRGQGWVAVSCVSHPVDEDLLRRFEQAREEM